jgi:hypothetical protein
MYLHRNLIVNVNVIVINTFDSYVTDTNAVSADIATAHAVSNRRDDGESCASLMCRQQARQQPFRQQRVA